MTFEQAPAAARAASALPVRRIVVDLAPRLVILASLAATVMAFHVYSWKNYEGPKRTLLLFGVTATLCLAYLAGGKYRERFTSPIGLPVQLLMFTAAAATLLAANISEGLEDLLDVGSRFVLMFLVMRYLQTWLEGRRMLFLVVFMGLLCAILGTCQYYGIGGSNFVFTRQCVATVGNPNYAAEVFNIVGFCAIPLLAYSLGRRNYGAAGFCALTLVMAFWQLFHIDSRASHFGIAMAVVVTGLAWLYYRGIHRLLAPGAFRFQLATALVLVALSYPVLNWMFIGAMDRATGKHTIHGTLTRALGYQSLFQPLLAESKLTYDSAPVIRLYHLMVGDEAPLRNASLLMRLLPLDDMQYRVLYRSLLGAILFCWGWFLLDRRGLLGDGNGPPRARHVAARLALLAGGLLWLLGMTLSLAKFAAVLAGGALLVAALGLLSWQVWAGGGRRRPVLFYYFAGVPVFVIGAALLVLGRSGKIFSATVLLGALCVLAGLVLLSGLVGHWWNSPHRTAVLRPALVVLVICLALVGGSAVLYKACYHPFIVETLNGRLPERSLDINTMLFRFEVYKSVVLTMADNVFRGIGAGNFKVIHELYTSQIERFVLGEEVLARKVHDTILHYGVEFGIVGFFAYFWLVLAYYLLCFRMLRWSTRQTRADERLSFASHREEAVFYLGLVGLGVMTVVFFNDLFGHTVILPGQATLYWAVIGLICGLGPALMRARHPARAWENNPTHPVAVADATVPPFHPLRYAVLGAIVLLSSLLWLNQFMAEVHLRRAMMAREVYAFEGQDPTARPMWGERSAAAYMWQRFLPSVMEPMYRGFGAFDHYRHAVALYPWQMETYYIVGRYYIDAMQELIDSQLPPLQEDSEQSRLHYFKRIETLYYGGVISLEEARRTLSEAEDTDALRRAYWQMSGLDPGRALEYVDRGKELYHTDLYMNPNYKWAHNNLGVIIDRGREQGASRGAYLRALILDPQQIFAHFNLGLGYRKEGRDIKSAMYFENAAGTEPEKWDAWVYGAEAYGDFGDDARAHRMLEGYFRALNILDATYAEFLRTRELTRADPPYPLIDAVQEARLPDANKKSPQLGRGFMQLGNIYRDRGMAALATAAYRLAGASDPESVLILSNEASTLLEDGRYEEALSVLQKLAQLAETRDPENTNRLGMIHYHLGVCYAALGQAQPSIAALRKAFDYRPQLEIQALRDSDLMRLAEEQPELKAFLEGS